MRAFVMVVARPGYRTHNLGNIKARMKTLLLLFFCISDLQAHANKTKEHHYLARVK